MSNTSLDVLKTNVDKNEYLAKLKQFYNGCCFSKKEEINEYTLDYPNKGVRSTFANALLEQYLRVSAMDLNALAITLPRALVKGDIEMAMNALPPFFVSIPYDIQVKDEKYYQTVIHLIFEFKLNGTAEETLEQIDRKDYLLPWTGSGKQLVKVGVSFNFEKRNIG
jgi:hypothetical protein